MPMEGARRHTHLGGDAFHLRPSSWPEEVLPNLLRDAGAGSPPVEEVAALLLAQARRPLVGLGQRLIHPLGIDRDPVHGLAEEDRSREVLGESIRVGRTREAEGHPAEGDRPQEEVALDSDRCRGIALHEELSALGRDVAVVEQDPEVVRSPLGPEAVEGKGEVQVADAELGGTAEGPATEERVAPDAIGRQPVPTPGLEPDAGKMAQVADEVAHHRELLGRLDLGERILEAVGPDVRAPQAGARRDPVVGGQTN